MKSVNQIFREMLQKVENLPPVPGNTLNYPKLRQEMKQKQSKGANLPQTTLNYRSLRSQFNKLKRNPLMKSDPNTATHIAGIPIPHELKQHFDSGAVVPQDHPLRETAANFVTQVWRKNRFDGENMSVKLLGIGEDGKMIDPSIKPGYATVKSERLNLRSLLKREPNL